MSETKIHIARSLEEVKKNFSELYLQKEEVVRELLEKLHEWLDYYCGKKGEDEEGSFDFTGRWIIRHRAKRHHLQGISQAIQVFSQAYGEIFSQLIRQEAERHIYEDMGTILFAEDYQRIGFWKNF